MPPLLTSLLSLLTLVLAVAAIVLATVANRRWASRPRAARESAPDAPAPQAGPDASVLAELRAHLEELGSHAADLRAGLDGLAVQVGVLREEADRTRGATDGLRFELTDLRADLTALQADVARVGTAPVHDPTALRHVALVRYDAFADVGGRLSYSVALLDDTRSGLVLTTLAGKSDVRTYVRTVSAGSGEGTLTAEEQQAIEAAAASGT